LTSDEAHFHLNGSVNKQNFRYWSTINPRQVHEHPLHCDRVTVWIAVRSDRAVFFLKRMAVQWQWIPPVMLSWSEIFLYPNYADVDWISSAFGSSKTGQLPTLPGKLWPNYGGCFLGSSFPTEVMCRGPTALRTCHLAISFCSGTSKEKRTSTSHEIFLSCRMQLRGNCGPYLAECVSRWWPTSLGVWTSASKTRVVI